MKNPFKRASDYLVEDLWNIDRSSLGGIGRFLLDAGRFVVVIVNDVLQGQLTLWAMGLVYTTLMSLVPLLAVGFSVLKAFGVQNKLEPFLLNFVVPLGENGQLIVRRIVEFVNNMKVGVLGAVGLGLLMWTVISLIQKTEQAFNAIWKVRGQRSMLHQFSEYLSVVLVGPVLVVSALALTASLTSTTLVRHIIEIEPFGTIIAAAGKLVPYVLVCASFTFLYIFLPNTKVRFSAGLAGGIVGGVLWQTVGWGFASFIVASTKYAAIYSSFAILILFMIWIYLSWLILLVGAEVSFYYQNPQLLSLGRRPNLPNARLIEQTAVSVMVLIASHYYEGRRAWTEDALARRLGAGWEQIEDILAVFRKKGLLIETADEPPAYVPARDLDTILLRDVYDAVRQVPEGDGRLAVTAAPAEAVVREVDEAITGVLKDRSLKDIVRSEEPQKRD